MVYVNDAKGPVRKQQVDRAEPSEVAERIEAARVERSAARFRPSPLHSRLFIR